MIKVAVISASYCRGRSYQENIWAEELSRLGYTVRVFTIGERTTAVETVFENGATYDVQPVRTYSLRSRHLYYTRGLISALIDYQPALILWFGVPMHFGHGLIDAAELTQIPVVAFFSLNSGMHNFDWTYRQPWKEWAKAFAFHLIRGTDVVKGCLRADVVVANTPETQEILQFFPRGERLRQIQEKIIVLPLGFSPVHFGFDPALRVRARRALGFSDEDVVIVSSSRFAPEKVDALEICVAAMQQVVQQEAGAHGLLVGFDSGSISDRFRKKIASTPQIQPHGFADRKQLAMLYHAADISLFARPTISCQESLGTGLVGVFGDDPCLVHLIQGADQGAYFQRTDQADATMVLLAGVRHVQGQPDRLAFRHTLAKRARWLGYDQIVADLLQRML